MNPRVAKHLKHAREDLEAATREPVGPRCLVMKKHYRDRARLLVKFARYLHQGYIKGVST